jgi:membrane protein YdbS with pleckstrin-like domain
VNRSPVVVSVTDEDKPDNSTLPWIRLIPLMLLVHPLRELIRYLPIILVALIAGSVGEEPWWVYVLSGLGILVGVLRWFTTSYRITNGHVQIKRGILNRQLLSVPRDRIRSVDVDSTILHRIFGLSVVKVGTGASHGVDNLEFNALRTGEVPAFRAEMLSHVPRSAAVITQATDDADVVGRNFSRWRPSWARYAPFTLSGVSSIVVVVFFVGHSLLPGWVVGRSGSLNRKRFVLATDGIIGWTIRRSPRGCREDPVQQRPKRPGRAGIPGSGKHHATQTEDVGVIRHGECLVHRIDAVNIFLLCPASDQASPIRAVLRRRRCRVQVEKVDRERDGLLVQIRMHERGDQVVQDLQRVRAGRNRTERNERKLVMPRHSVNGALDHENQALLPRALVQRWKRDIRERPIQHGVQQVVAILHVDIQGRRPGVEFLTDAAHREGVHPVLIQDSQAGLDDEGATQRFLRRALTAADRSCRHAQ